MRVLFVSNGHGEAAIADRIACELQQARPAAQLDHLGLVGDTPSEWLHDVGPRRAMPSGGLIAMGNLRNIAHDLRAGLLGLTLDQRRFLRNARGQYDVAVAVGDVYALAMALRARAAAVFVGSAKSASVAPYGPFETRILRRARACFVRDEATAAALRADALEPEVANAIVDLFATSDDPAAQLAVDGFAPALALFPGSRDSAYADAAFLLDVVAALAASVRSLGAALSIAPGLDAQRFAAEALVRGWQVRSIHNQRMPFALSRDGRELVRVWRGPLGPLLRRVALVLGQAGTAQEAAAAAGVPIVAFERDDGKSQWYRRRQRGLLGDALTVLPAECDAAVSGVRALLDDPARRARMAETGRARMGAPGAAGRIAERVVTIAEAR